VAPKELRTVPSQSEPSREQEGPIEEPEGFPTDLAAADENPLVDPLPARARQEPALSFRARAHAWLGAR